MGKLGSKIKEGKRCPDSTGIQWEGRHVLGLSVMECREAELLAPGWRGVGWGGVRWGRGWDRDGGGAASEAPTSSFPVCQMAHLSKKATQGRITRRTKNSSGVSNL